MATIMKPAVIVGTEDWILNSWAHFAKNWSFLPPIGNGSTKIQLVYVVGVVAAIVVALKDMAQVWGRSMNLGGRGFYHAPASGFIYFSFYLLPLEKAHHFDKKLIIQGAELMYKTTCEWLNIPFPIARALACPGRLLLLKKVPFPLPKGGPKYIYLALTFKDLGIVPHKLKAKPVKYLISYWKPGPSFGSTISEKVIGNEL